MRKYIDQFDGIITLGGLSESGKSTAGYYLQTLGVMRQKIIEIEKEMMIDRGYDLSNGLKDEFFINLYSNNLNDVFDEFLWRLSIKMKKKKIGYVSLESLYRPEFAVYLKKRFGNRAINIYIECSFENRVLREFKKIKSQNIDISIDELKNLVFEKDKFKVNHNAAKVKDIADIIIDNNNLSIEDFEDILHKQIFYLRNL